MVVKTMFGVYLRMVKNSYLHFLVNVPTYDETTGDGMGNDDWNFSCEGYMTIDRETSTAIISPTKSE